MLDKKSKGFTLIELLVVIAIIAILASIVLISLGVSRNRARDARIMTSLSQVRPIAEIVNSNDGEYDSICAVTNDDIGTVQGLNVLGLDLDTHLPSGGGIACFAEANRYCVAVDLNMGGSFCISSDGMANTVASSSSDTCLSALSSCSD